MPTVVRDKTTTAVICIGLPFQFFVVEEGKDAGVFLTKSRQNIFTVAPNDLDNILNQLSPEYRLVTFLRLVL